MLKTDAMRQMPKEALERNIRLVLSRQNPLIDCAFRGETSIRKAIQRLQGKDPSQFDLELGNIIYVINKFEGLSKLTADEEGCLSCDKIKKDTRKRRLVDWIPNIYATGGGAIALASIFVSAQLPIKQIQMFGISVNAAVTAVLTTAFISFAVKRGIDLADRLGEKYPAANAMKRLESLAEVVDRMIECARSISPPTPVPAASPKPPVQANVLASQTITLSPKSQIDPARTQKFKVKKQL